MGWKVEIFTFTGMSASVAANGCWGPLQPPLPWAKQRVKQPPPRESLLPLKYLDLCSSEFEV